MKSKNQVAKKENDCLGKTNVEELGGGQGKNHIKMEKKKEKTNMEVRKRKHNSREKTTREAGWGLKAGERPGVTRAKPSRRVKRLQKRNKKRNNR